MLFGVRIYCFEMSLNTQYFEKIILKHLRLQPAAFYKTALILEVSRKLKKAARVCGGISFTERAAN